MRACAPGRTASPVTRPPCKTGPTVRRFEGRPTLSPLRVAFTPQKASLLRQTHYRYVGPLAQLERAISALPVKRSPALSKSFINLKGVPIADCSPG
jgi:hypothetical protein